MIIINVFIFYVVFVIYDFVIVVFICVFFGVECFVFIFFIVNDFVYVFWYVLVCFILCVFDNLVDL